MSEDRAAEQQHSHSWQLVAQAGRSQGTAGHGAWGDGHADLCQGLGSDPRSRSRSGSHGPRPLVDDLAGHQDCRSSRLPCRSVGGVVDRQIITLIRLTFVALCWSAVVIAYGAAAALVIGRACGACGGTVGLPPPGPVAGPLPAEGKEPPGRLSPGAPQEGTQVPQALLGARGGPDPQGLTPSLPGAVAAALLLNRNGGPCVVRV